jgi:hypothetical protein
MAKRRDRSFVHRLEHQREDDDFYVVEIEYQFTACYVVRMEKGAMPHGTSLPEPEGSDPKHYPELLKDLGIIGGPTIRVGTGYATPRPLSLTVRPAYRTFALAPTTEGQMGADLLAEGLTPSAIARKLKAKFHPEELEDDEEGEQ